MTVVFFSKCAKKGSLLDHFPHKKIQNSFKYSLNKWFRMGKSVDVVEKKIKCHLGLALGYTFHNKVLQEAPGY